jgi:hypothetical protein
MRVKRLNQKQIHLHTIDSPNLPNDSRVKIALVARPPLTPLIQKLSRCEHGVLQAECVFVLELRVEIIYSCSRSI